MTSADVAREAGVSRATVSYVLNDVPNQTIPASTQAAVLGAAQRLGYRPNPRARALKLGRSDTVLLLLPGVTLGHVWNDAIDACSAALTEYGFTLATDFSRYRSADERSAAWLRLDPAVVIDLAVRPNDAALGSLRELGVPLVSSVTRFTSGRLSVLDAIFDEARSTQVAHVIERGCERIVLAVPAAERRDQFRPGRQVAMHRAVRSSRRQLRIEEVDLDRASILAAIDRWTSDGLPDALCAYNDVLGLALLDLLASKGVRVPDDVLVIGVDDHPLSAVVSPGLTTVAWNVEQLGQSLAATSRALLDGEDASFLLPAIAVIVRESA